MVLFGGIVGVGKSAVRGAVRAGVKEGAEVGTEGALARGVARGVDPFRVSFAPRAGSALKADPHHAFPDIVDNFARNAKRFEIPTRGAGGEIVRTSELLQVNGSLNGKSGIFEWVVDQGKMVHRRFISGGKITGFPNQVPGR
jgi:filamentous hemagglutinin